MTSVISGVTVTGTARKWLRYLRKELNFYRIHLIIFTITPLLFSVLFYLSNGRYKISYVDSLFNCVSAMTVCGLATVDLSTLTPWQQVILLMQMCIGSPIVASWLMVFNRRRYIRTSCSHIFTDFMAKKESEAQRKGSWRRFLCSLGIPSPTPSIVSDEERTSDKEKDRPAVSRSHSKVRPDMIRRMDDKPMLINPSGLVTGETPEIQVTSATPGDISPDTTPAPLIRQRTISSKQQSSEESGKGSASKAHDPFPRAMTVEFASDLPRPRMRVARTITEHNASEPDRASKQFPTNLSLSNHPSHHSSRILHPHRSAKHQGYGGFPGPHIILKRLFRRLFPTLDRKLTRTLTIPVTTSLVSVPTKHAYEKHAPYVRDSIRVGRNSQFDVNSIGQDQLIEIAYMEYQALGLLLWVIALYHFGCQIIVFVVIAPYISLARWRDDFVPPQLVRPVNSVWFSAFQAISAYTNTGTSLVDQSMLPFQRAYPMVFLMMFLILAGNTCFPIFLRFFIWCLSKAAKPDTDMHKVLHFLLDHPRRCFLYLFPSHQTWFLLTVVIILTSIDWVFFLILDLGNEVLQTIPTGVRVLSGLMQSIAVRAAGFAIVPLGALAPAVKVLYVIMMYISVYPIAMSIRSTNVYEEKSLGIFHDGVNKEDGEEAFSHDGPRMTVWSRYLAMHARQQLAFDMWWIAISLFVLCIAEAHNLNDPSKYQWFTVFNMLFELVSAYGTVGLSLGLPTNNYSFSGAFRPISKLIICAVMIRGRHRGLPVAIDRAVMFPREYQDPHSPDQEPRLESESDSESDSSSIGRETDNMSSSERGLPSVAEVVGEPESESDPFQLARDLRRELQKVLAPQSEIRKDVESGQDIPGGKFQLAAHLRATGSKPMDLDSVKTWRDEIGTAEAKYSENGLEEPHGRRGDPSVESYHQSEARF